MHDCLVDWKRRPAPDEWSVSEVICHLRDVETEVHQARFRQVVRQPGTFLSGVSADEWAQQRGYLAQNAREALLAFLSARQETIATLSALPAEAWLLTGEHAFFGRTTLHELLFMVVRHDELHRQQIEDTVAALADAQRTPKGGNDEGQ